MPGFVRFLEEAVQAHPLQLMLCAAQEPPGSEQLQKTIHICMFLEQRPVEPTGFQYGIVGTDFPSHPLCLFMDLPGDRSLLSAPHILVRTGHDSVFIDRNLKEHVGIILEDFAC